MRQWSTPLGTILLCLVAIAPPATGGDEEQLTVRGKTLDLAKVTPDSFVGLDKDCARHKAEAEATKNTVFERLESARAYRLCIESLAVAVQAAAADGLHAFAARQLAESQVEAAEALEAEKKAPAKFMDLSWGLGFGFSFGFDDALEDAVVVDGIVRVTEDRTDRPRAVLEFHRYFWCNKGQTLTDRGCGPFVAVAADPDDVLKGVGMGFIFGRRSKIPTSEDGFSLGIGGILDADVKTLADGFDEGQPLPTGETSVRFEEKSRWSALVYVTRTF